MASRKNLLALGINIFGGGFTLGVMRAGFDVVGQWEESDYGAKTFNLNHRYFGRVRQHPLSYGEWPLANAPRINLIYANPPCAPWSNARENRETGGLNDPRLEMTARTMSAAISLAPDVFICESVSQAWTNGADYYREWAVKWIAEGYGVTFFLTDGILHGLASARERFHFIAHRRYLPLVEPDMRTFIPRTVRMAIEDIMDSFGQFPHHVPSRLFRGYHLAIRECPPGSSVRKYALIAREKYDEFITMPPFVARRLFWDSPATTLVNTAMTAHPERLRTITPREAMRLLGYPDDFLVSDPKDPRTLTRAVTPTVAEYLGRATIRSIEYAHLARREARLVDWRDMSKPYRQRAVLDALREEL